ncbi:uncharacterized protein [Heterodontus francisci]|uniref:uncharacterized protein n=1 Tax=Heterodontus francisci TaxID=7792 RepID=UPI00355B4653
MAIWELAGRSFKSLFDRAGRVCVNRHGLIRRYGLNMCHQCFRRYVKDIGFVKSALQKKEYVEHSPARERVLVWPLNNSTTFKYCFG